MTGDDPRRRRLALNPMRGMRPAQGMPARADDVDTAFQLRPWDEVAAEFTRRTGLPITVTCARMIGSNAVRKLRGKLAN